MKERDDRGITLIELLVGITVLAFVGLMAGAFLNVSTKLGRRTATYADIQSESQSVMRRLTDAVMNGESVYIDQDALGTVIFTGKQAVQSGGTHYTGETFFFDKAGHSLYQKRSGDFTVNSAEGTSAPLNSSSVKDAIVSKEYLISDKLEDMDVSLEIGGVLQENADGMKEADGSVTVRFELTFSNNESRGYRCSSGSTARNTPNLIWYYKN